MNNTNTKARGMTMNTRKTAQTQWKGQSAPFKVWLVNFGFEATGSPVRTLDEARDLARRAGFEATVFHNGDPVAAWSPIGGWSRINNQPKGGEI